MENNDEILEKTKKCFWCKKLIPKKAFRCPYCGAKTFKLVLLRIIITILLFMFALYIVGLV